MPFKRVGVSCAARLLVVMVNQGKIDALSRAAFQY